MYLATGFYQHGDLDMLEVGNNGRGNPSGNLTYAEQKSHFTAWAFMKSHLLIGTDLRNATNSTIEILTNKEVIEINQDPNEGQAIAPFRTGIQPDNSVITYNATYPPPYWAGNSTKGPIFMIINTLNETQTMGFNLTENCTLVVYHLHLPKLCLHSFQGLFVQAASTQYEICGRTRMSVSQSGTGLSRLVLMMSLHCF